MREIIFRGNTINPFDGWVYGSLLAIKDTETEVIEYRILGVDGYGKSRVIPESIGQYTGLKDKNGIEIYEGDIVLVGEQHKFQATIFFNKNVSSFQYQYGGILGNDVSGTLYDFETKLRLEVIGKVFENHELLTNKTKTV